MFAHLVNQSLRYRLFAVISVVGMMVYGMLALRDMPVDVLPDLTPPTVTLMTEAKGLSPEEVESLVSYPIESGMSGLPGMERVRSVSAAGLSIVYLEFGWDTDVYRDRQFVIERLEQVTESLPENMLPFITPVSAMTGEVMLISLTAEATSAMALRELVDWVVRPRLLAIPGVAQVIPIGGEVRQYQVMPNAAQMALLNVSFDELIDALDKFGLNTGGGFVEQNDREFVIRNVARTQALDDLKRLVVAQRNGVSIRLEQLATITYAPQVKRGDAGYMGRPAVTVSVQKQPSVNTVSLSTDIKDAMKSLAENLPEDVTMHMDVYDQAEFINTSVGNVKEVLVEASIVVAVILFLFLMNTRTTFISLVAIPVSLCAAILVLKAMGQTINIMTLGGLAIAIGELVDDAIVGVENVFRRLRQNAKLENPRTIMAVVSDASIEVRSGILIATVIIVVVLIPLFALGGIEGRMFKPFAAAYIISILASLLTAITITPVLCYYLLPHGRLVHSDDSRLLKTLKAYNRKIVAWALKRTKSVVAVVTIAFIAVTLSLVAMPRIFMPTMNEGSIVVIAELPNGVSLQTSNRLGAVMERLLMKVPEVTSVGRRTGRGELDEHAESISVSEMIVTYERGKRPDAVIREDLRTALVGTTARIFLDQPLSHRINAAISGVRAKIALKVFGDDLDTIRSIAAKFEEKLNTIPGIGDVAMESQSRIPQIEISVDYDRAAAYGVSPAAVTEALQSLAMGMQVSEILDGERRFDVTIRMQEADRTSAALGQLLIETLDGHVPLSAFATVRETDGPTNIKRENTRRRVVVRANAESDDMSSVVEAIRQTISETPLPAGYFAELDGTFNAQEKASRAILGLSLVSLLMIFVVLYSRYRFASLSLIIMAMIPIAMMGGVLGLWVTGQPLSIASMFGFVALAGISARNGILKISHYINLYLNEGEDFGHDLIKRGSDERLAPVLMTTVSAGLALIPLLLAADQPGKEILHPIAVVIFSGLLSAVMIDTVLTPVLFKLVGRRPLELLTKRHDTIGVKEAY